MDNRLTELIDELHSTISYTDYVELRDLSDELILENEQLKARLDKAVELPSIRQIEWAGKVVYQVIHEANTPTKFVTTDQYLVLAEAEARLAELKGERE